MRACAARSFDPRVFSIRFTISYLNITYIDVYIYTLVITHHALIKWKLSFPNQTSVQRRRRCPAAEGYRWTSSWSVRRVKNYDTDVALTWLQDWLGWGVRLSIRPSISFPIARSSYFTIFRCLWPGFCFGQYRLLFMCLEDYSTCVGKERATTAVTPCSSVSRG